MNKPTEIKSVLNALRWLWPVFFTVYAVASYLTRDDPPKTWWIPVAVLALGSWVIEIQQSLINDQRAYIARLRGEEVDSR